jgi:hypothetical protein
METIGLGSRMEQTNVSTEFVARHFGCSRRTIARAAIRAGLNRKVGHSLVFLWPMDREKLKASMPGKVGNPNFRRRKRP